MSRTVGSQQAPSSFQLLLISCAVLSTSHRLAMDSLITPKALAMLPHFIMVSLAAADPRMFVTACTRADLAALVDQVVPTVLQCLQYFQLAVRGRRAWQPPALLALLSALEVGLVFECESCGLLCIIGADPALLQSP